MKKQTEKPRTRRGVTHAPWPIMVNPSLLSKKALDIFSPKEILIIISLLGGLQNRSIIEIYIEDYEKEICRNLKIDKKKFYSTVAKAQKKGIKFE